MDSGITFFWFFFFYTAVVFSSVASYNITAVLESYPSFSTFNDYLIRTGIATTINSHTPPPVTVLAVDNANISTSLSGTALNVLKKIMSAHVILDYFDAPKLQRLGNRSVTVATLFNSRGEALNNHQQGYINITGFGSGNVGFTAAAPTALGQSSLVTSLVSQPYNFSLLQISNVIVPSGIHNNSANSSSGPVSSPVMPPASSPKTPPAASPSRAPGGSPSRAPDASPAEPPAPSPAGASPAKAPAASPTRPPAESPTRPPAASPTKPPSAPSPRKMKSPAPAPSSTAPTPTPAAAPNTPAAGNDESSATTTRRIHGFLVAAATVSSNLFLVFMV
ncbi:unnamed protein product [Cuscuta epithymum]|uniref:FAS1 domain-containing protein n=1 Tax=Cuscuta epithymum TaxID=186058 RepID=A0AAV0GKV1_9ASTE|nr:unnamed protein product [Cuscuta epithymum]